MDWIERWNSLAARIDGLLSAANFVTQTLQVHNSFAPGTLRALRSEADSLAVEMRSLYEEESANMPDAAATALGELVANGETPQSQAGFESSYLQSLSPLFVFRSRFSYLIRDSEVEARNATEFAFEHLKRLIVVSPDVRAAWNSAFAENEIACERLGSVHLLSHGIWAFKVQGHGAATDLVYSEPLIRNSSILRRSSKTIVLTEWKLVRSPESTAEIARAARVQASEYSGGVLGDLELKRTRYVVLVGKRHQRPPDDVAFGGIAYRHVWIPVDPEPPSVAARRQSRGSAKRS